MPDWFVRKNSPPLPYLGPSICLRSGVSRVIVLILQSSPSQSDIYFVDSFSFFFYSFSLSNCVYLSSFGSQRLVRSIIGLSIFNFLTKMKILLFVLSALLFSIVESQIFRTIRFVPVPYQGPRIFRGKCYIFLYN